nr:hypothetical protein DA06_23045 [Georgenia sp. SUBG003]
MEWLTAGGTIAAAVVPFVLFLVERSDRKSAEAEVSAIRAREDEERVMAQARRVTIWNDSRRIPNKLSPIFFCVVHNASDMPIFNVELFAFRIWEDEETGAEFRARTGGHQTRTVAPGHDWEIQVRYLNTKEPVWVKFTDARDQVWFRCEDGTLTNDEDEFKKRLEDQALFRVPEEPDY